MEPRDSVPASLVSATFARGNELPPPAEVSLVGSPICPFSRNELVERSRTFSRFDTGAKDADEFFALMAAFQKDLPVFRSEMFGGHWVVTRYADCYQILRDDVAFSSREFQIPRWEIPGVQGGALPESLDAPEHGIYRNALNEPLAMRRMHSLVPTATDIARATLANLVSAGSGDLVAEFCIPFPVSMFLLVLGAPVDDTAKLLSWKNLLFTDGYSPDDQVRRGFFDNVMPDIMEYFDKLVDSRRSSSQPPDDLLTAMAFAKVGDRLWSRDELHRTYIQYLAAGLDTVTGALSLMLEFLIRNPVRRQELIADRTLIPAAVEEMLRYQGIASPARFVTMASELGGETLQPGDIVQLILASTGRDAEEFADPDTVDFRRSPNRHIAFGVGRHRCHGQHLARMELQVGIEVFLDLMPDVRFAPNARPERRFGAVHAFTNLEVVV
jgi:cytochrome P450